MQRSLGTIGAGLLLLACTAAIGQQRDAVHWQPVQRLVGEWSGTSTGRPGSGTVERRYAFVLGDRYIQETSISVYPPQERNARGEVHEHWGMLSYDRARKSVVLRQFHVEGFVNTYRLAPGDHEGNVLVFDSEGFENLGAAWKARETYEFSSEDAFVETFELAAPGKPFEVYSRTQFKRVRR